MNDKIYWHIDYEVGPRPIHAWGKIDQHHGYIAEDRFSSDADAEEAVRRWIKQYGGQLVGEWPSKVKLVEVGVRSPKK